jgi:tetratricopeptide (TPR) repeat protein
MNLTDKRLAQLDNPSLTPYEKALIRCQLAAEFIHTGQYEAAQDALAHLWTGIGQQPNLVGLKELAQAEVLLQCGALTGWLGSTGQGVNPQEAAKNLLTKALHIFTKKGKATRAAEAEYELGICYWRQGAYDEARAVLQVARQKLGDNDVDLKAKILIRSTIVEISNKRYHEVLRILDEAESVYEVANDALKGKWHAQKAIALFYLGSAEKSDYFDRAIVEYTAAIHYLGLAKHERYCGNNLNNLAILLEKLGRYAEAHDYLDRAYTIFARLNDPENIAQVNETRAHVLLGEGRNEEALSTIKSVVTTLERGGEYALLADAIVVQATALARLGDHDRSLPLFRHAINTAEDAGALTNAGLAALTMIEEQHNRIPPMELLLMYSRTDDLLRQTQDTEAIARLRACARLVIRAQRGPKLSDPGFSLTKVMRAYEYRFIKQALENSQGSISRAARLLGIPYQSLGYVIKTRHKDLMSKRTPIKKRRSSIIKKR